MKQILILLLFISSFCQAQIWRAQPYYSEPDTGIGAGESLGPELVQQGDMSSSINWNEV